MGECPHGGGDEEAIDKKKMDKVRIGMTGLVVLLLILTIGAGTVASAQYSSATQYVRGETEVHPYNSDSGAGGVWFPTVKPVAYPQIRRGNAFIPRKLVTNPRFPAYTRRYASRRLIYTSVTPSSTPPITEGKALPFETISKGGLNVIMRGGPIERKKWVITNNSDWTNLWNNMHFYLVNPKPPFPKPPLPEIDFERYMIIGVFHSHTCVPGSNWIEVTKVIETENTLEVFVKEHYFGPESAGCTVPKICMQPYHVIKLPKKDKEVIFRVSQEVIRCQ